MHVLLDDVIAAEPDEVIPIPNLVLHFGRIGPASAIPDAGHVEVGTRVLQFAQKAVVNLPDDLSVIWAMAQMVANGHDQALLLRFIACSLDLPISWRIDGNGFFHEYVLPRCDHRFEVLGAKAWRRCEHYHIRIGLQHLLIGIQTDKLPRLGNFRLVGIEGLDLPQAGGEIFTEHIRHGDEFDVAVVFMALWTAPVPRPPQPTNASRIGSRPPAQTARTSRGAQR